MNKFLHLITFLFIFNTAFAQKVKLKKGVVYLDEKEILLFERDLARTECSIFTLDKEEIIYIRNNDNETVGYFQDDFVQIVFFGSTDVKLESTEFKHYTFKKIINKLIEEKVLEENGTINEENLNKLFTKYDENITERTIR